MLNEEIERLRGRYGNMTEPEAVNSDENVLNLTFTETDKAGNEIEGGINNDKISALVKYFSESFRPSLIGRKVGESFDVNLEEAFAPKEREWILNDLGLDSSTDKHFKATITKIGLVEPKELDEAFFTQLFPNDAITTEADFRERLRAEIQKQLDNESRNQLHHNLYHVLLENTHIDFPADFLKRWLKTQGEKEQQKSDEQVESEMPDFLNQLKWTLITEKLAADNNITVQQDDLRSFAKEQLLGYMGMQNLNDEEGWVRDYIDRMMKDRKYVEDAYNRLQTQKIFDFAASQVNVVETPISKDEFIRMNEEHNRKHH
jgi:trigger factor